jgi:hypothetical protein
VFQSLRFVGAVIHLNHINKLDAIMGEKRRGQYFQFFQDVRHAQANPKTMAHKRIKDAFTTDKDRN